ncbi:MAG: transposase, partial [Acidobacteriia bacterium]|nr:transposase [Terriglobia bacterium]
APDNVRRMHQSLHHLVADAPWDDEALLDRALDTVLPAMLDRGPLVAWIVDDTGFVKKGKHSVGVARPKKKFYKKMWDQLNDQASQNGLEVTDYVKNILTKRLN